jgi:hypothetical protein
MSYDDWKTTDPADAQPHWLEPCPWCKLAHWEHEDCIVEFEAHGALVAQARTALGISVSEFGRVLGIDRRTLQRWERGDTVPGTAWIALFFMLCLVDYDLAYTLPLPARFRAWSKERGLMMDDEDDLRPH